MQDREIVAAIVAGHPGGLAAAYDRYARPLHAFATATLGEPSDAADAVQDTFIIAAAKLGGLRDPDRLRPWLYDVARNECRRRLRERASASPLEEAGDLADDAPAVGARAEQHDLRGLVRSALGGLNPGEREIIELNLRHELDGDDLAAALGVRSMVQGAPRTPVIRRFWVHSVASATIGQDFARFFRINPQLVYIGAVLHDLGRLGLLAAHPEEYTTLALSSHESTDAILAAEQAGFGMTHCHAGALLARAWSLPDPVQHIAEQHHQAGSDHEVVALVQLCCRLADDLEFQAIHRRDIQAPEETIKALAPGHLREQLTGRLDDVKTAILRAMETLDF